MTMTSAPLSSAAPSFAPNQSCAIEAGLPLAPAAFTQIHRRMLLDHCKWDPQVGDVRAMASFPLIIPRSQWQTLSAMAQTLYEETLRAENHLLARPVLYSALGVPRPLRRLLATIARGRAASPPTAARVMRFDFHPTPDGWRISEVNADVPGGYAESSAFPALMAEHYADCHPAGDPAEALVGAILCDIDRRGDASNPNPLCVTLLCAPGFIEDLQVVSYLAARLRERGAEAVITSPEALTWDARHALISSPTGPRRVSAIVRFYQAEWLPRLPRRTRPASQPLLAGGLTPVVNPPAAILTESKRFPLVWPVLPFDLPAWRALLPETRDPQTVTRNASRSGDWLLKAAYSNTGDAVLGPSISSPRNWRRAVWSARLFPHQWVAQRRFSITPIDSPSGPVYPCLGVYVIDGTPAGIYARISPQTVIDFSSTDVALLIRDDSPITIRSEDLLQ